MKVLCKKMSEESQNFMSSYVDASSSSISTSSVVESEDLANQIQRTSFFEGHVITDPKELNEINAVDRRSQDVTNIDIKDSKDIIIGNVTYITGPVYVTKTGGGNVGILNETQFTESSETEEDFDENSPLQIIRRKKWCLRCIKLLEPYEYLQEPAKYVIIAHTATERSYNKFGNIELVRNIQAYHINSRRWNDISYNFLIGSCGYVFEGRGWGVVGAHTDGYNKRSVGISFIGCYITELPPQKSLYACQKLIEKGVEEGHISPDYKLVAHCQCKATESPGRLLYDVLKTWPHFASGSDNTSN